MRAGDPLGGHYVQGHVDAVGRVQSVEAEGEGLRVFVEAPQEVLRYCVEKGSVTIDGVSLTIAELDPEGFAIALVPHTLEATTLSTLAPGQKVNLEADVLAKYVERLLAAARATISRNERRQGPRRPSPRSRRSRPRSRISARASSSSSSTTPTARTRAT